MLNPKQFFLHLRLKILNTQHENILFELFQNY